MNLKYISKTHARVPFGSLVRLCVVLGIVLLALAATSSAAVIVQTTNFIASPAAFNGFEGMTAELYGGTSYTEGGIVVTYVGTPSDGTIWTALPGGQGSHDWYPDGGGSGYDDIKLSSGAEFSAIQFLAGSGWAGGGGSLQYQVLDRGVVIASGNAGAVPAAEASFVYYGFSGGSFDEIQLQSQYCANCAFATGAFEAFALDSIAIGDAGGSIPEPASIVLLGIGLLGIAAVRRRA